MVTYARLDACRYRMVKRWIQKVQKFRRESKTLAEISAWDKVEVWMKTLLSKTRYIDQKAVIRMHPPTEQDFEDVLDEIAGYANDMKLEEIGADRDD